MEGESRTQGACKIQNDQAKLEYLEIQNTAPWSLLYAEEAPVKDPWIYKKRPKKLQKE